jgi:hypothetical protein
VELLHNPVFIVFAFLTITSVVSTLAVYWHKVKRAEMDAALKQQMLERGMSAEEIRIVIESSSDRRRETPALKGSIPDEHS